METIPWGYWGAVANKKQLQASINYICDVYLNGDVKMTEATNNRFLRLVSIYRQALTLF